ncbi:hypothetical protein F4604DRAFT_1687741 [Suillus subluteus]|nr:hypothetical protein F4604DRAFT_1687741 [Suillus subluteus]
MSDVPPNTPFPKPDYTPLCSNGHSKLQWRIVASNAHGRCKSPSCTGAMSHCLPLLLLVAGMMVVGCREAADSEALEGGTDEKSEEEDALDDDSIVVLVPRSEACIKTRLITGEGGHAVQVTGTGSIGGGGGGIAGSIDGFGDDDRL